MSRDITKPVWRLNESGYGLQRAASALHWMLHYQGPHRIFVDNSGSIFAFPCGSTQDDAWCRHRSEWLVGTYAINGIRTSKASNAVRDLIAGDLRARMRELRSIAA